MKIEKAKVFTVGDMNFGSLRDAQMYLLEQWLRRFAGNTAGQIADSIAADPEGFRGVVAPFISKPRGRRPKAAEGQGELKLEVGEDGEPQVVACSLAEAAADMALNDEIGVDQSGKRNRKAA